MIKSTIRSAGFLVSALALLLSSCGSSWTQSGQPYAIDDKAGSYAGKVPGLLKEAEALTGKKFKGRKIVIFHPETDIKSISELATKMNRMDGEADDADGTIAWTAYHDASETAFVQPIVARPPRWAMVHEFGHVVLMSNGIEGHPKKYANKFKYW